MYRSVRNKAATESESKHTKGLFLSFLKVSETKFPAIFMFDQTQI